MLRVRRALLAALVAALFALPVVGTPDGVAGPAVADAARAEPSDACGTRPKRADGTYYACTFVDHFSGTRLNDRTWAAAPTRETGLSGGNRACYVNNDRTLRVQGGLLRLTSTMLPTAFRCTSRGTSWTTRFESVSITTRSLFTQTNGRFEARIKMPAEAGVAGSHSAFWLYPQHHTYGGWPASGEIDIAEWFSADPHRVYPSVHYGGHNRALSTGYECRMPTASTAFHTYAVEWNRTVMTFYYDGKECFSHAWRPFLLRSPKPFDKPFYFVLTQVWGKSWNLRSASMPSRSTLQVDWVKAWR